MSSHAGVFAKKAAFHPKRKILRAKPEKGVFAREGFSSKGRFSEGHEPVFLA